ncbi:hypothetical protein LCGC14_3075380, partial [marine sediment metagenome]
MAINVKTKYPDNADAASLDYPSGSFRNDSTPSSEDGTPLEVAWMNDFLGSRDAVLLEGGITPSGDPDTAQVSDFLNGLKQIIANNTTHAPVGGLLQIWDHIPGVDEPDNSGTVKYIKLTAGEDGVGEYNEGLLAGETLADGGGLGDPEDVTVTATISYAASPMNGQVVNLINSEKSAVIPGESSGTLILDAIRNITGSIGTDRAQITSGSGALAGPSGYANANADGGSLNIGRGFTFDASRVVRTASRNQIKAREATFYMR